MSAKLIEAAGFKAAFLRAYGVQASLLGSPNVGYGTMTEHVDCARRITDVIAIPLIVDVGTGFGDAIAVHRTVRELERAGVAAIQIEDQSRAWSPHSGGAHVPLLSVKEMTSKIRAAVDARASADFLVIVWTFGTYQSMSEAVRRANFYAEAGADLIMPSLSPFLPYGGASTKPDEIVRRLKEFASAISVPIATHSPLATELPVAYAEEAGVKLYAATQVALAPAAAAIRASLAALASGTIAEHFRANPPYSIVEMGKLLGIDEFVAMARRFGFAQEPEDSGT